MNTTVKSLLGVAGLLVAANAAAQVTFYDGENFRGRTFTADRPVGNFDRFGFNDRAASAIVDSGQWEVCEDARFGGRCVVLQPGRYRDLGSVNLKFQISSVRPLDANVGYNNDRAGYAVAQGYDNDQRRYRDGDRNDYRRRNGERLYQAEVTDVHAVVGPPEQRCWVERRDVVSDNDNGRRVGGAIAGAVIGGILGHQIGGGRGKDVATAAGAVGGAALGSNIARGGDESVSTQDVQRCENVPSQAQADYWDVTYFFDGREHHVQMTSPPGRTITVNGDGEPRV